MSTRCHEPQPQTAARSRRRSIRLPGPFWSSLTAIILLVITVALGITFRYYRERQIEARLAHLGARCETKILAPDWLRQLVDDRWLKPYQRINVVIFNYVPFEDVQLDDDDLSVLEGLTEVEHLSLNRTRVTDDALEHLEHLRSLKTLRLVDTEITDEGLEHLMKLTRLETLDLYRTHVTGAGLQRLRELANLRFLRRPDEFSSTYLPPPRD
jgi:hypothetical protein